MRTIEVSEGQTLLDIAMQECGDVSAVYDIADLNGRSITDELVIGEELLLPDILDEDITEMFLQAYRKPASSETDDSEVSDEGLEYWYIEVDFVIS